MRKNLFISAAIASVLFSTQPSNALINNPELCQTEYGVSFHWGYQAGRGDLTRCLITTSKTTYQRVDIYRPELGYHMDTMSYNTTFDGIDNEACESEVRKILAGMPTQCSRGYGLSSDNPDIDSDAVEPDPIDIATDVPPPSSPSPVPTATPAPTPDSDFDCSLPPEKNFVSWDLLSETEKAYNQRAYDSICGSTPAPAPAPIPTPEATPLPTPPSPDTVVHCDSKPTFTYDTSTGICSVQDDAVVTYADGRSANVNPQQSIPLGIMSRYDCEHQYRNSCAIVGATGDTYHDPAFTETTSMPGLEDF